MTQIKPTQIKPTQHRRSPPIVLRQFVRHNLFGNLVYISDIRVTPGKVVVIDLEQSIDAKETKIFDRIDGYLEFCGDLNLI
jgi:hypothetical protein